MFRELIEKYNYIFNRLKRGYKEDINELFNNIITADNSCLMCNQVCTKDSLFIVEQSCDCKINIIDNSYCLYSEDTFNYEDTLTLDIITKEKLDTTEIVALSFIPHIKDHSLNESQISLKSDGRFKITHIIIPTLEWYLKKDWSCQKYKNIYITDHNKIYKIENKEYIEIDPLDLTTNINLEKSTIVKDEKLFFTICYLYKCYMNMCTELLSTMEKNAPTYDKDLDKNIVYKRDFLYISIKILQKLIECCNFEDSEEIIEGLEGCNGFCPHYSIINKSTSSECGCK